MTKDRIVSLYNNKKFEEIESLIPILPKNLKVRLVRLKNKTVLHIQEGDKKYKYGD